MTSHLHASACSKLLQHSALECCQQHLNAALLCLFAGAYAYSVASANSTARPNVGQTATAAAAAQAVSRVTACPADLISTYAQVRSASDCRAVNSMLAGLRLIWGYNSVPVHQVSTWTWALKCKHLPASCLTALLGQHASTTPVAGCVSGARLTRFCRTPDLEACLPHSCVRRHRSMPRRSCPGSSAFLHGPH